MYVGECIEFQVEIALQYFGNILKDVLDFSEARGTM